MVKLVINSIYNLYLEIQNFNQNTSIIHSFFHQLITQNIGAEFTEARACSVRNTVELSSPMTEGLPQEQGMTGFLTVETVKWTWDILK